MIVAGLMPDAVPGGRDRFPGRTWIWLQSNGTRIWLQSTDQNLAPEQRVQYSQALAHSPPAVAPPPATRALQNKPPAT